MTIIDQTQIWENKCHWGRLHGGSTLCRLSHTTLLLAAIRHTYTHRNTPLCSDSALSALIRAVHSQQRNRIVHCAFIPPCIPNVNILYISTLEMGGWRRRRRRSPLGPHHRLLTDQECFPDAAPQESDYGKVLSFFSPPQYFQPSLLIFFSYFSPHNHRQVRCLSGRRRHSLHIDETRSQSLMLEDGPASSESRSSQRKPCFHRIFSVMASTG